MSALCFVSGGGVTVLGKNGCGCVRSSTLSSRWAQRSGGGVLRSERAVVRMGFSDPNGKPDGKDRFTSVLPYLLPLLDSLQYGGFLFSKYPLLRDTLLVPLAPLYKLYRGVPFLDIALFFAVFFLIVRNMNLPRYIRYNAQQAILLDLVLILPSLFSGMGKSVPAFVAETASNSIFYGMLAAIGYATVENIRGNLPNQIPLISESVDSQIGPY